MPSSDVGAIFAKAGVEIAEEEDGASLTKLEAEHGKGLPPLMNVHRGVAGVRCVDGLWGGV